jgi:hypothetical protein
MSMTSTGANGTESAPFDAMAEEARIWESNSKNTTDQAKEVHDKKVLIRS